MTTGIDFWPLRSLLVCVLASISGFAQTNQSNECWEYKLVVKTYSTEVQGNEVLEDEWMKGPFSSQEECQADAAKRRGTIDGKGSWWLRKKEATTDECKSCGKEEKDEEGSSAIQPKGKGQVNSQAGSFDKRNRLMERDYYDKLQGEKMTKWFREIVDPINKSNLISALGVYLDSSILQALGTAIGAIGVARAYNAMWQQASEASLNRALDLINITRDEHQKFLTASGAYLLSAPDKYTRVGDASLIQNAFLTAASYERSRPTGEAAYTSAVLLGAAGLIAAETGNEKNASILLSAATDVLRQAPANTKRSEMESLLQNTSTTFSVDLKPPSDVSRTQPSPVPRSTKPVDTPDVPNIAGEYECVSGIGCMPSGTNYYTTPLCTIASTRSPLIVTQNGTDIVVEFFDETVSSCQNTTQNTTKGITRGTGKIVNNRAQLNYERVEDGLRQHLSSSTATMTILSDQELEFSVTYPDGRTYTVIFRRS